MNPLLDVESLRPGTADASRLFLEIVEAVEDRPVSPPASPAGLAGIGEQGVGILRALEEVRDQILPHAMGIGHPCYMGLVNSSPLPAAALADLLVSALNNNAGASHQSHALLAAEREVVRAFAGRLGLPPHGMALPGGTFANLQALVLARTAAFGEGLPSSARLYTSAAAHFSVGRAARVASLRREQVRTLPANGRGALDADSLAEAIEADRRAGLAPFAVVATLGTTGTGAIDPLPRISEICRRRRIWLHVDACYGGASLLLDPPPVSMPECDSVAIDPHEWFFIPVVAALLFHRHPKIAARAFADDASYIPAAGEAEPWQLGIPTSRRAAGFTIWVALRTHGWSAIRDAVARNIALTRRLEEVLASAGLRVLPDGELSVACARDEPSEWPAEEMDNLQKAIAERVCATGRAWFSTVRHGGQIWLRFNIVNFRTRDSHVDAVVELVLNAAAELRGAATR
jgi:aromatic-L-amino-acid/L-tryptophan decarboxylase